MGEDRAVYFVRHEAGALWWVGLSVDTPLGAGEFHLGLKFANVYRGRLIGSTVLGEWVDTPRGDVPQTGSMDLSLVSTDEMRRLRQTGGFGCSAWRRTDLPARVDAFAEFTEQLGAGSSHGRGLVARAESVVAHGTVVRSLAAEGDDISFTVRLDRPLQDSGTASLTVPDGQSAVNAEQQQTMVCTILGRTRSPRLPGWMQRDGSSVLFLDGRPVNGDASVAPDGSARLRGRELPPGTRVRVCGFLASRPTASGQVDSVVICPVNSIDIVAPVARGSLTGIWASDDGGTYYVRQIGDSVWWLGMSHDQGRTFTNAFSGQITANGTESVIHGESVDVPLGARRDSGPISLHTSDATTLTAEDGNPRRWTKISDRLDQ
ncbi:thioesterase family protein [Streptomyces canus]|uniref:hypothetical protein n=1 Tax=Streptomyces canus TaxID=58343 RepID=UPI003246E55D